MKRNFVIILILLAVLLISSIYKSNLIFAIFPEDQRTFLKVTSNITALVNSATGVLIYAVIFFLCYNLSKLTDAQPREYIFYEIVGDIMLLILLVEILKLFLIYFFLRDEIELLIPDDTIVDQLKSTEWQVYIQITEIGFLTMLPLFSFFRFKVYEISNKNSLINSLYILSGFLIASFI